MKELITEQEFNALANQDRLVLLDFYADWCGPCKALLPTIEKLAIKYDGKVVIQKVNVDRNPQLAQKFKIRSIPALFLMKDGEVVESALGYKTEKALEDMIARHQTESVS